MNNQNFMFRPLKFNLADSSVEALKWLALILMSIDHINHFLFKMQVPVMYELGRIAMPLFGFVLAYNLARPGTLQKGIHVRAMQRLFIFGLLATPIFIVLKSWFPLNIMFTLLLATYLIYLIERDKLDDRLICFFTFIIGGFFVEYAWLTPAYCLAAWWFCKSPNLARGLLWIGITAMLWVVNGNYWACAAIPIIFMASFIKLKIARMRLVFYSYYPIHLALLLLIQKFLPISI
jgi:uncharacterized membrane protein